MSAFQELSFICLFIDAFFAYCAALVPYFIAPAFAISLGISSSTATYLIAVLNVAQFFGRVIPAYLSDYYGGAYMLLFAQVAVALLGLTWPAIKNIHGFVAFLVFNGFASGAVATLPATVIPHICPSPTTLGTRIGMIYAAAGVGVLIGNPVALATTGHGGDRKQFLGAQLWMGFCALIGAAFYVLPGITTSKHRASLTRTQTKTRMSSPWEDLRRLSCRRHNDQQSVEL